MKRVTLVRFAGLAVFAGTLALAACGGGGHTVAPGSTVVPAPAGGLGSSIKVKKSTLTLKIKVPSKTVTSATKRAPLYLSAASQGLAIYAYPVIAPSPSAPSVVADLNPSDAGSVCTANTDGTRSCSVSFPAPDGNDVITIGAYDQSPSAGSIPLTANLLSAGTVDTTILANQVNTVNVTLAGVVAGLRFSRPAVFLQSNAASNQVSVNAVDADGNIIVSDPFANPITVTANNVPPIGGCSSGSPYSNAFTFGAANGLANAGTLTTALASADATTFALYYNGLPCNTWAQTLVANSTLSATATIPGTATVVSASPIPVYPDFYIFTGQSPNGSNTIVKVDPGQNLVTDSVGYGSGTLVGLAPASAEYSIAAMVSTGGGNSTLSTYSYNGRMSAGTGTVEGVQYGTALWFNTSSAGVPSLYALASGSYNPLLRFPVSAPASAGQGMTLQPAAPSPIYSAPLTFGAIGGTNLAYTGATGSSDCIDMADTSNGNLYAVTDDGSGQPTSNESLTPFYLPNSPSSIAAFTVGALGDSIFWGDSGGVSLLSLIGCGAPASGPQVASNPGTSAPLSAVMSPDDGAVFVLYGGATPSVALFQTAGFNGQTPMLAPLPAGFSPVSIAIDPGGTTLIVGGTNAQIVLLSAIDGSYLQTLVVDSPSSNAGLYQLAVADNVLGVTSVSKARRPLTAVPVHHYSWVRRR